MPASDIRQSTSLPNVSLPINCATVRLVTVDEGNDGQRLDNFLAATFKGVPRDHLYRIIRSGEVRVNKGRSAAAYRLSLGDVVRLPPIRVADASQKNPARASEFPILFEDDHLLIINKPAGLAVHGGSGLAFGVIEQLRAARPQAKFLELAHRLDRETSGILVLAKKRPALIAIHEGLRTGQWEKRYAALVSGDWVNQHQHIRLALTKIVTPNGERRVFVDPNGQHAHTVIDLKQRYQPVDIIKSGCFESFTLVEALLKTGRTHQIRVHLSASGFPILGDDKYGDSQINQELNKSPYKKHMFLHAQRLVMPHPDNLMPVTIDAPFPAFWDAFLLNLEAR